MLIITLLIGIACQGAVNAPVGKCNPPNMQYSVATDKAQAVQDLKTCNEARDKLRVELKARGAEFDTLLYCDQRQIPYS
jgi:hypothetical protein